MMSAVNSWFSIRIDVITASIMLVMSVMCIFLRDVTDPIVISLILNY